MAGSAIISFFQGSTQLVSFFQQLFGHLTLLFLPLYPPFEATSTHCAACAGTADLEQHKTCFEMQFQHFTQYLNAS